MPHRGERSASPDSCQFDRRPLERSSSSAELPPTTRLGDDSCATGGSSDHFADRRPLRRSSQSDRYGSRTAAMAAVIAGGALAIRCQRQRWRNRSLAALQHHGGPLSDSDHLTRCWEQAARPRSHALRAKVPLPSLRRGCRLAGSRRPNGDCRSLRPRRRRPRRRVGGIRSVRRCVLDPTSFSSRVFCEPAARRVPTMTSPASGRVTICSAGLRSLLASPPGEGHLWVRCGDVEAGAATRHRARLADFVELVATAIANAETCELIASRARLWRPPTTPVAASTRSPRRHTPAVSGVGLS